MRNKCRDLGITFDPWQDAVGRLALAKRADGKYASTIGGVTLSIPRQVGKTYLVGSLLFALCILNPKMTVIWTAHRAKTAGETFDTMQGFARRLKIKPYVEAVYLGSGDEEVRFRNGSRILFGARERGFGRGFAAVDVLVFDEAQILTEKALDDMVATTNRSKQESGALLFYMGTPPRPIDPGEAFTLKRTKALSGKSDDMVYVEFSADYGADPDDREQWAKANPSFPVHTSVESMLRMRENMLTDESFLREGLGIWDDDAALSVFGVGAWSGCLGEIPGDYRISALGLAVSVDLKASALVWGARAGERVLPLPVRHGAGTDWLIDAAVAAASEKRVPIVLDGGGPGAFLVPSLRKAARAKGVRVIEAAMPDMKDACAAIFQQVASGVLLHGGWPLMDAAVGGAEQRTVGDRWLWGRRAKKGQDKAPDISLLEAATVALWGQDNVRTRSATDQRLAEGGTAVLTI